MLDTGASYVTLSNCRSGVVTSIRGNGSHSYGLQVAAGVNNIKVLGCDFTGNGAGWNILSTDKTNVYRDNTTEHGVGDAVTVWRTTNQPVASGSPVDVLFDSEPADHNNMHDETGGGTAPLFGWAPGFYTACATVEFAASPTGYGQLAFLRSDGVYFGGIFRVNDPSATEPTIINGCAQTHLTAGQSVKIQVVQTAGRALSLTSAPQYAPAASPVKQ